MTIKMHVCPYCKGDGFVSKKKSAENVVLIARDRKKFNAAMQKVNERARAKKKMAAT
jgi:hypothetical protein